MRRASTWDARQALPISQQTISVSIRVPRAGNDVGAGFT
jgi:hypothetical protein